MIPSKAGTEFAARVEEVQETYECPSDPQQPAVCRAERPVQLVQETRTAGGDDGASKAR